DDKESEHICERVVPQFQHANSSVVLAAVKVIMIHMRNVRREELLKQPVRKMAPPLVTLLSTPPEVQWVALRNVNLQKRPGIRCARPRRGASARGGGGRSRRVRAGATRRGGGERGGQRRG
ncbi:hypothetical protein EV122DRAFT_256825, partial [Schizophyllum commune]